MSWVFLGISLGLHPREKSLGKPMQSLTQMGRVLHPCKQQSTMLGCRISISDFHHIFIQKMSFSKIHFLLVPMEVSAPGSAHAGRSAWLRICTAEIFGTHIRGEGTNLKHFPIKVLAISGNYNHFSFLKIARLRSCDIY